MNFNGHKSVNIGNVRVTFSLSGIGVSVGNKDDNIRLSSRGNVVRMSKKGIDYRIDWGKKKSRNQKAQAASREKEPSGQAAEEQLFFQEIESADISSLTDDSLQELIDQINLKMKKLPFWPLALLLVFIPYTGPFLTAVMAVFIHFRIDQKRRIAVLFYEMDEHTEKQMQQYYHAFDELIRCSAKWHVTAQADVGEGKHHGGASRLAQRSPIIIKYDTPAKIRTNVQVPSIPAGRQTLYFFPGMLLILEGKVVAGVSYDQLQISQSNERFVETETVPEDGAIEEYTWQYVNKSGERDKRFKDNRQLPVMRYSEIQFTSAKGLNERIICSKEGVGKDLENARNTYAKFLKNNML